MQANGGSVKYSLAEDEYSRQLHYMTDNVTPPALPVLPVVCPLSLASSRQADCGRVRVQGGYYCFCSEAVCTLPFVHQPCCLPDTRFHLQTSI